MSLTGRAEAISHGAATIINAIATGKGAAVGVDLWTKAAVALTDEAGTRGRYLSVLTLQKILLWHRRLLSVSSNISV